MFSVLFLKNVVVDGTAMSFVVSASMLYRTVFVCVCVCVEVVALAKV